MIALVASAIFWGVPAEPGAVTAHTRKTKNPPA
jgi:hypothetical protein